MLGHLKEGHNHSHQLIYLSLVLHYLQMGHLLYQLNIWSPAFKSPKDAFGSIQITNIGSFDIDNAFVPIAPYTNIPMVISLGSIKKRPLVINDKVEAVEIIKACLTVDHRLMEGVHFGKMQKKIIQYFEAPSDM